jgi:hypothetical protein
MYTHVSKCKNNKRKEKNWLRYTYIYICTYNSEQILSAQNNIAELMEKRHGGKCL